MKANENTGEEGTISEENYRAFLLRCWQEPGAGLERCPVWRIALVEVGDESDKRGFASLEDLIDYLQEELA